MGTIIYRLLKADVTSVGDGFWGTWNHALFSYSYWGFQGEYASPSTPGTYEFTLSSILQTHAAAVGTILHVEVTIVRDVLGSGLFGETIVFPEGDSATYEERFSGGSQTQVTRTLAVPALVGVDVSEMNGKSFGVRWDSTVAGYQYLVTYVTDVYVTVTYDGPSLTSHLNPLTKMLRCKAVADDVTEDGTCTWTPAGTTGFRGTFNSGTEPEELPANWGGSVTLVNQLDVLALEPGYITAYKLVVTHSTPTVDDEDHTYNIFPHTGTNIFLQGYVPTELAGVFTMLGTQFVGRDLNTVGEDTVKMVVAYGAVTGQPGLTDTISDFYLLIEYDGPPMSVTSATPATGPTAGGENITIIGTVFGADATVTIGGEAASNVVCVNPTTLTCDVPAGAAGTVDVVVSRPGA